MRISPTERDILGRIGLSADKSLNELARIAKRKAHTVRYAITRLEEREILHPSWVIDVFRLGWQRVQVLLALGGANRAKVINYFKKAPRITHVAEIGGQYDIDILVVAKNIEEVLSLLQEAALACGAAFRERAILIQSSIHYFPRKYLCHGKPTLGAIIMGDRKGTYETSPLEELILESLIAEPQITKRALADKAKVSIPTIDAKLKRLKGEGVIKGALFSSRYVELGMQNYKILVTTTGATAAFRNKLYKLVYEHPYCTSFREGIGAWDYEINAEIENYRQITELKDLLWREFGDAIHSVHLIPRFKLSFYNSYPVTSHSPKH